MNKVIISCLLIVLALLGGITLYRVENLPKDNSCINLKCVSCKEKYYCQNYTTIEKIRYVWNLY